MSDYFPDIDTLRMGLPLFVAASRSTEARAFHERDEAQASVLASLRSGVAIQKNQYESAAKNGSRLAPVVEQLRNAHGFAISGYGTTAKPYRLDDVRQRPTLARSTPEMQAAYYQTPHWLNAKRQREAMDGHRCVLCGNNKDLRCHHVCYGRLFNEPPSDLLTLCDLCHGRVHLHCRLKFPSGISVKYAHLLGWKGFETWLLP